MNIPVGYEYTVMDAENITKCVRKMIEILNLAIYANFKKSSMSF